MTTTTVTPEAALAELNVATIAELKTLLRETGITGNRHSAIRCPIANYVRTRTGIDAINVTSRVLHIYRTSTGWGPVGELPITARSFIAMFDAGLLREFRSTYERFRDVFS